jgi:hypothetical protein
MSRSVPMQIWGMARAAGFKMNRPLFGHEALHNLIHGATDDKQTFKTYSVFSAAYYCSAEV